MKTRDVGIDALKIISMLAVVALHTQRNSGEGICFNYVFYYVCRFAMPVFFMVNGALIMSKDSFQLDYYKKKLLNIVRVLVTWGFISVILSFLVMKFTIKDSIVNGIKCILGAYIVPFWFIFTLILIYTLLLFFFEKIKKNINAILIVLGVTCVLIDFISLINIFKFNGDFVQSPISQRFRIWSWGFYFLLGYRLKDLKINIKQHIMVIIGSVFISIIAVIYQYWLFAVYLQQINSSNFYESILMMIWAGSVFLVFCNHVYSPLSSKIIVFISKYIWGIFLLHGYFIHYLNLTERFTTPLSAFVEWLCLCIGCFGLTYLFSKIPIVKRIFEY